MCSVIKKHVHTHIHIIVQLRKGKARLFMCLFVCVHFTLIKKKYIYITYHMQFSNTIGFPVFFPAPTAGKICNETCENFCVLHTGNTQLLLCVIS